MGMYVCYHRCEAKNQRFLVDHFLLATLWLLDEKTFKWHFVKFIADVVTIVMQHAVKEQKTSSGSVQFRFCPAPLVNWHKHP